MDPSSRLSVRAVPPSIPPLRRPAGSSVTPRLSERGGEEGEACRTRAGGTGGPAHLTEEREGPRLSRTWGPGQGGRARRVLSAC